VKRDNYSMYLSYCVISRIIPLIRAGLRHFATDDSLRQTCVESATAVWRATLCHTDDLDGYNNLSLCVFCVGDYLFTDG
jgi:hypothetical protein